MLEWGDIDTFCNQYGFYSNQNPLQEPIFPPKDQQTPSHQRDLLLNQQNPNLLPEKTRVNDKQKLSTDQILKLAGERFVQFSSQKFININVLMHPYGSSLADLTLEDKQDVELSQLLLAAAEKVSHQQNDRALKLLSNCQWIASKAGTPVQRAVYYFAEALLERIKKGNDGDMVSGAKFEKANDACYERNIPALVAMHQRLPFFQVMHFTAAQMILENVEKKSKVHLIDFDIFTGLHWAGLMQAIAERELDPGGYLKITAIVTVDKPNAEKTGNLLKSFARNLNLPFSYKVVFLPDLKDLKEEDFDIDPDESVAVLFHYVLRTLIAKPVCLKNMITVMQKVKPSIMIVVEVEGNHNSPTFVSRFIEALFFYGALFDSLEDSMARDSGARMDIESGTFREGIRNIVAAEGHHRVTRSVSISVWRAFFARFCMVELELSTCSLYQACLLVNRFPCGHSCTLDVGTKCLLVGWKGTPLFSLSAWKFH